MITQARLKEVVSYDPETGVFTWHNVRSDMHGKEAGWSDKYGYRHFQVDGKYYSAHRMAWLYVHGRMPSGHIDHIDRSTNNNRIANLRDVTPAQNLQNIEGPRPHNKSSGVLGVSWHKKGKRWRAMICVNRKQIHIGFFDSKEEAGKAYLLAKKQFHPFGEVNAA